ncbi:MAG: phosphoglycerate dehydrogenase [Armatimonadetes bacterium]|nr:phosphoglycerate dehydrogenase [Armatimonadota bacterium]
MAKILVSDPLAPEGISLLQRAGFDVDVRTGLTKPELITIIGQYHALAVRSETKVTADVLDAATNLQIIGRAGVGVDNIDVERATQRGILVVNSPEGNTLAAAELTVALILALSRNIAPANATMKAGKWDRKLYTGVEVYGKTVGVVGLGKIGREVAKRLIGMGMDILAYDPFLGQEQAEALGVRLVDLPALYRDSDYITVHVPKTKETAGMIGAAQIAQMKPGVRLINVARGGIYQETAVLDGLNSGHVGGAAFDVWETEPTAPDNPLALHPRCLATPHLGASTEEAQVGVSVDVAEQIVEVLLGRSARAAVNMPSLAADLLAITAPYLKLAEKIGSLQSQLSTSGVVSVEVTYEGDFAGNQQVHLTRALMRGLLSPILSASVNYVNAPTLAAERGIRLTESRRDAAPNAEFQNRIIVEARALSGRDCVIEGTVYGASDTRIVGIDGYAVDFKPEGMHVITRHQDRPGMVGRVGTLLGEANINIAGMYCGRAVKRGHSIMALSVDDAVPAEVVATLAAMDGMEAVRFVEL